MNANDTSPLLKENTDQRWALNLKLWVVRTLTELLVVTYKVCLRTYQEV